jgi:hypothetical protein
MKPYLIQIVLVLVACGARGQTFQYDQQSYTVQNTPGGIASIQTQQPIGQSFIPNLSSIGFISLYFSDQTASGVGATVSVNLWSGSISNGTLLGSTDPIFIRHGFFNYTNLFFSTPVALTPGTTYYFQPLVQSGDQDQNMTTGITSGFVYPSGTAIINGAVSGFDILFREGVVIVPEPSSASLALLGVAGFYFRRRR